jgi:hypothetical protein
MKLALQILLGDLDITQRHVGGAVAKQFHQRRQLPRARGREWASNRVD